MHITVLGIWDDISQQGAQGARGVCPEKIFPYWQTSMTAWHK